MRFLQYDFDSSSYQNTKDKFKMEAVAGARKANYFKRYLGDAEYARDLTLGAGVGVPEWNPTNPKLEIDNRVVAWVVLIDGEDYYENYLKLGNEPALPRKDDEPNTFELGPVIATIADYQKNTLPLLQATFPTASYYHNAHSIKSYESGSSGTNKVIPNALDLLAFIRHYQVAGELPFQFSKVDGSTPTIAETIDWIEDVRTVFLNNDGHVIVDNMYIIPAGLTDLDGNTMQTSLSTDKIYTDITIQSDNYNLHYKRGVYGLNEDSIKSYGSLIINPPSRYEAKYIGQKLVAASVTLEGDTEVSSTVEELYRPDYTYTEVLKFPTRKPGTTIIEKYGAGTDDDIETKLGKVLYAAMGWLQRYSNLSNRTRVSTADVVPILDVLLEDANDRQDLLDSNVGEALKTPLGKILGSDKAVRNFLETDIKTLNEMWMVFRIHLLDTMNNMEDPDERNDRDMVEEFMTQIPKWYRYVYPILHPDVNYANQSVTTDYRVIGYVPNWKNMLKLNPRQFMYVMQVMGDRVEYGTPKPKKSWGKIIFAIIVIVVVTIYSAGTATTAAASAFGSVLAGNIAAAVVIIGGVASIAGILTGSKTWGKIGTIASVATLAISAGADIIKQGISASLKYAMQLVTMVMEHVYDKKIGKMQKNLDDLTDEVDDIKELTDTYEKERKIKEFVYTDHHGHRYTYSYDLMYDYRVW